MTRAELDEMIVKGVAHPSKEVALQLRPNCHPDDPLYFVEVDGNSYVFLCSTCSEYVDSFEGEWIRMKEGSKFHRTSRGFEQACHFDAAALCLYRKGSGKLEIRCHDCKEVVATIKIK